MTPQEIEILSGIRGTKFQSFFPTGRSIHEAEKFDALVELLQRMQREGLIELEVSPSRMQVGYYQRKYRAAVAHCTDSGREALKDLGGGA